MDKATLMMIRRIVGPIIFGLAVAVAAASAQQPDSGTTTPPAPAVTTTQTEYAEAGVTPWQRQHTRTTSAGRELTVEIELAPGVEGRLEPARETRTETVATSPDTASVRVERTGVGLQHQHLLLEVIQSEQAHVPDNGKQTVTQTLSADVNGRLGLLSQSIEEQQSSADSSASTVSVFVPDINQGLREAIRNAQTARKIGPADEVQQRTDAIRDINGRWQPVETRSVEAHGTAASGRVEEETISRRDLNDTLGISEKTITTRSGSNGREEVLIERYVPRDPAAIHRSNSRMDLQERTRQTTTVAADGSRETIEEVEGRNPVAAGDPLRLRRRVVTSVRQVAPDRWVTERQVFDLDPNGRLVPSITERTESSNP